MRLAYVDTSCLVKIALGEPGHRQLARRLESFDRRFACNLGEAELRAAFAREQQELDPGVILSWLSWVLPDRPLTAEYRRVLDQGYVRGADLRHLACAVFLTDMLGPLSFVTADSQQRRVARRLALPT